VIMYRPSADEPCRQASTKSTNDRLADSGDPFGQLGRARDMHLQSSSLQTCVEASAAMCYSRQIGASAR
jgi:hypothetical protein